METRATLPRADEAEIDPAKLEEYLLNPEHAKGRHKLRRFEETLGIGEGDGDYLSSAILDGLPSARVVSVRPNPPWGINYEVWLPIEGLNGKIRTVVTAWIIEDGGRPRFITAYVP